MPTYDYKCEKCGHEFEDMLPIAEEMDSIGFHMRTIR